MFVDIILPEVCWFGVNGTREKKKGKKSRNNNRKKNKTKEEDMKKKNKNKKKKRNELDVLGRPALARFSVTQRPPRDTPEGCIKH